MIDLSITILVVSTFKYGIDLLSTLHFKYGVSLPALVGSILAPSVIGSSTANDDSLRGTN